MNGMVWKSCKEQYYWFNNFFSEIKLIGYIRPEKSQNSRLNLSMDSSANSSKNFDILSLVE
jgi:hypothetical protein